MFLSDLTLPKRGQSRIIRKITEIPAPSLQEYDEALCFWIRFSQNERFKDEIEALASEDEISKSSPIRTLQPYLDPEGTLRVGGRMKLMDIEENWKHPIILASNHTLTNLLIYHIHCTIGCGGVNYTHNVIRQKYWIINSKSSIKRTIKNCIKCRIMNPKIRDQIVSPLPPERVGVHQCFTHIGIDLSGVLHTVDKVRVDEEVITQYNKRYYLASVCFYSRSVHLEVINDRSAEEILNALRRTFARRGFPQFVFCDGEKGFRRIDAELHNVFAGVDLKQMKRGLNEEGIEFLFNVPMSPHRAGIYEIMNKLIKKIVR